MISIQKVDSKKLDSGVTDFAPVECMNCEFDGFIPIEYYQVLGEVKSEKDHQQLENLVKKDLGYETFSEMGSEQFPHLIGVNRCPKCNSEEIFMDL